MRHAATPTAGRNVRPRRITLCTLTRDGPRTSASIGPRRLVPSIRCDPISWDQKVVTTIDPARDVYRVLAQYRSCRRSAPKSCCGRSTGPAPGRRVGRRRRWRRLARSGLRPPAARTRSLSPRPATDRAVTYVTRGAWVRVLPEGH